MLVEEGQHVSSGQPLAQLDAEAVSSLEKAVAQREVALRDATEELAAAKDPNTPLDVAEAESKVANAKVSLQTAQDALARVLEPTDRDIAEAGAKVANAMISLDKAQEDLATLLQPGAQEIAQAGSKVSSAREALEAAEEALARLLEPTSRDIAQAESSVVNSKIAVEDASTALTELKDGPTGDDVVAARAKVEAAETALANAHGDRGLAQTEWAGKLEAAQESAEAARQAYRDVLSKWLGTQASDQETDVHPDTLLESWGVNLTSLFDRSDEPEFDPQASPVDDPETIWNETVVYNWLNLYPGALSVSCETGVPFQGACVGAEIDDAWDAHRGAQDQLATVRVQGDKAVANADAAVTRDEERPARLRRMPSPRYWSRQTLSKSPRRRGNSSWPRPLWKRPRRS